MLDVSVAIRHEDVYAIRIVPKRGDRSSALRFLNRWYCGPHVLPGHADAGRSGIPGPMTVSHPQLESDSIQPERCHGGAGFGLR